MRKGAAVVLLSGGMDSATALFWARRRFRRCIALAVDYGQTHQRELHAARRVARAAGIPLVESRCEFPWGGSALTDRRLAIPVRRNLRGIGRRIPVTYVPARNAIFLGLAAGCAEALGADAIVIGANALDYSGYPDCRPGFLRAFERALALGTKRGVGGRRLRILAPLLRLGKPGIVRLGRRLGVPLDMTYSCYRGGRQLCGRCDACVLREKGFRDA